MSDMLQTGLAWLADQTEAYASQTIVYERAAYSVTFAATLGSQLLKTTDRGGNVKVERTDRDFIFRAALLILNGSLTTPERGDRIKLTLDGVTKRFDVMAPGNEPPWRYSDPHQTMIRVHTKFIGVV